MAWYRAICFDVHIWKIKLAVLKSNVKFFVIFFLLMIGSVGNAAFFELEREETHWLLLGMHKECPPVSSCEEEPPVRTALPLEQDMRNEDCHWAMLGYF